MAPLEIPLIACDNHTVDDDGRRTAANRRIQGKYLHPGWKFIPVYGLRKPKGSGENARLLKRQAR
jgi:hypothetical protein